MFSNKCLYLCILFICSSFVSSESLPLDSVVSTAKEINTSGSILNQDKTVNSTIREESNSDQKVGKINDISDKVLGKVFQDGTLKDFGSGMPTFNNGKSESETEDKSIQGKVPSSLSNDDHGGMSIVTNHTKGRKGVKYPGSAVVPRKGVDQQGTNSIESLTSENTLHFVKDIVVTSVASDKTTVTTGNQSNEKDLQKMPKKPEVVSDIGDEFDKYSIIKTSTTGEDYVIIGIVIVIGIWLSVFGALMFYRRAGEYWDRRHYRRMDFLVEGMYND